LEWQYLQQVVPDTGAVLAPIEAALADTFLPALLEEPREQTPSLREIATLPVWHAGLGIPDPTITVAQNYAASRELTDPLTLLITTSTELSVHGYAKACVGAQKMQQK